MTQHSKPAHRPKRSPAKHRKSSAGIKATKVAAAAAGAVLIGGGIAHVVTPTSWLGGQTAALYHAASAGPVASTSPSPAQQGHSGATGRGHALSDPTSNSHPHAHPHQAARDSSASGSSPSPRPSAASARPAASPSPRASTSGYANPLRSVSGLMAQRVDMGADFGGTGPVYALGNAVITNASATSYGWPGGGWITYRLTSGPAKGLTVFLAENVTPTVTVGQQVSSSTVIGNMNNAGIETGWAMPDGSSAESQLPAAGGISGNGPFPTVIGLNFDELLQSLGVPAGYGAGNTPYGVLPPGYPTKY